MNKHDSKPLDKKDLQELEQADVSQVTGGAFPFPYKEEDPHERFWRLILLSKQQQEKYMNGW